MLPVLTNDSLLLKLFYQDVLTLSKAIIVLFILSYTLYQHNLQEKHSLFQEARQIF